MTTLSDNISIRKYNPDTDKKEVFDIWFENHQNQISDREDLRQRRRTFYHLLEYIDGSFEVFVAVFENEIIGYQSALPMRNNPISWSEHAISSTFVKSNYQGSGVGYLLLKRMLQHLPDSNIKLFFGQSKANNTKMINIGEKLGFIKIGEIPSSNKKPQTDKLVLHVYNVPEI